MSPHAFEVLRQVSLAVGFIGAVLLSFRLVATWDRISKLAKSLGVALLIGVVASAYGSTRALNGNIAAYEDVVWVLFFARAAVVAVAILWPWDE